MANMTFAKNPVTSTLKHGWDAWRSSGQAAKNAWKTAGKDKSIWDKLGSSGSAGLKQLEGYSFGAGWKGTAGVGAVGGAGLLAAAPVADMVNPWGLGWGD